MAHLDPDQINCGDQVIGSLPVSLAARVCAQGGRYFHLTLDLPAELRGVELSAKQMTQCDARLEEYRIERLTERGQSV